MFLTSINHQASSCRITVFAVLFFVAASRNLGVDAFAFASNPSPSLSLLTGARPSTAHTSSSSTQLQFFAGYEMGGTDAVNNKDNNRKEESSSTNETEDPLFVLSLVTKMVIILIIKTAKDVINYPPNLLDQYNRNQQVRNQEIATDLQTEDIASYSHNDNENTPVTVTVTLMAAEESAQESIITTSTTSTSDTCSSDTYTTLPLELTKTNPFILLAKFVGVLTYKTLHDSIYYPALWINNSLNPPPNDDSYNYY